MNNDTSWYYLDQNIIFLNSVKEICKSTKVNEVFLCMDYGQRLLHRYDVFLSCPFTLRTFFIKLLNLPLSM